MAFVGHTNMLYWENTNFVFEGHTQIWRFRDTHKYSVWGTYTNMMFGGRTQIWRFGDTQKYGVLGKDTNVAFWVVLCTNVVY